MACHSEEAARSARGLGLAGRLLVGVLAAVDVGAVVWALVDVTQHPDKVRRSRRPDAPLDLAA